MKYFALCLLLLLSSNFLRAQEFLFDLNADNVGLYMSVEGFPESELPDGADSIFFVYFQEEAVLGYAICKQEKLYLMKKFDQDEDIWFNWAKATYTGTYEKGRVQFCSQLPFRATIACDFFKWTGKTFEYHETDLTDPSADSMDEAAVLRKEGKICEAMDTYNEVMYPFSYFSAEHLFSEILLESHSIALEHYRKKEYEKAAILMQCGLDNGWFNFSEEFMEDGQWTAPDTLPKEKYVEIMGDYGLFLVRAKRFEQAVEVNQNLVVFAPEVVGPLLQLGDAQYQLGKMEDAKATYRQYHNKMTAAGRENKVPSRVLKRI